MAPRPQLLGSRPTTSCSRKLPDAAGQRRQNRGHDTRRFGRLRCNRPRNKNLIPSLKSPTRSQDDLHHLARVKIVERRAMPGAWWSEHATGRRPIRPNPAPPPPPPSTPEAEADEMLPPHGYRKSYRSCHPGECQLPALTRHRCLRRPRPAFIEGSGAVNYLAERSDRSPCRRFYCYMATGDIFDIEALRGSNTGLIRQAIASIASAIGGCRIMTVGRLEAHYTVKVIDNIPGLPRANRGRFA